LKRRRWPFLLVVIVFAIAGGVGWDKLHFRAADLGFEHVTGLDLPANVTAVSHGSEMNDNLCHRTHYWELTGSSETLRELASRLHLVRSDEDAASVLVGVAKAIPFSEPPRLLEGYEGSRDGGRDRWVMILEPGDRAVIAY
jgi:hypothetical protein